MKQSEKAEQKIATDQKEPQSRDSRMPADEAAKNELSDETLQDVTGGCATGEHRPVA